MALRTIVSRIWDEVLWDLIKAGLKSGVGIFTGRVQELITKNPRQALVLVLLSMESEDRANLMDAYQEYLRQGRENRFVRELGEVLPRTPEGKLDEEGARRILKELNDVPADELKMFLEFLNHDPVAEWFRYWILGKGEEVLVGSAEVLAHLAALGINFVEKQVPEVAERIDHWAANTAAPKLRKADRRVARKLNRFANWLDR